MTVDLIINCSPDEREYITETEKIINTLVFNMNKYSISTYAGMNIEKLYGIVESLEKVSKQLYDDWRKNNG